MLNLKSPLARRIMSNFFSPRCKEQRFQKSSKAFEETVKPIPQKVKVKEAEVKHEESSFWAAYTEFRKQSQAVFTYPLLAPEDNEVCKFWDSKFTLPKDISRKKGIVSFVPSHPATKGILDTLLGKEQGYFPDVPPQFGITHVDCDLYLKGQFPFERFDYLSFLIEEIPARLANERHLDLSAPNNVEYIYKFFSEIMRMADPNASYAISAAVLDCGNITLLFWQFEERDKLSEFCRRAASVRTHSINMISGSTNATFALGFCHDFFEFPCRFLHDFDELEHMTTDYGLCKPYFEAEVEMVLDSSVRLYDTCTKLYIERMRKMREASLILFNSLKKEPPADIKAGDQKLSDVQRSKIQDSVGLLINHFQNYNLPDGIAQLDALSIRENAEEPLFGVSGMGWYIASLPRKDPFR